MTNKELIQKFQILVADEKKATRLVLEHIAMIESRRAFLDLGFDGMYRYMVDGLGYSEAAAHRRIMASRTLRLSPAIGEKLEEGRLNLTQLAQVSQLIRSTKQQPDLALFEQLENQGKSATEKILAQSFNVAPQQITHTRTQRDESVRIETTFSKEQFALLEEARSQLSHICPDGDWTQFISELARQFTKKLQPRPAAPRECFENSNSKTPPAGSNNPRFIRITQRRELLAAAKNCCQHVHPQTGVRCRSKYQLQVDHKFPMAWGGRNETQNLHILCAQHNRAKGAWPQEEMVASSE